MDKNYRTKRVFLWFGIIILIGGAVFGMIKLAGRTPANQTALLANAVSASDWIQGDKNSKVVLVEYSDFQCPACKIFYSFLKQISAKYGTKIELIYRNFPLLYHTNTALAAQAAGAAGKQGKFWEMHDMIFEGQDAWANQSNADAEKTFASYAQALSLNIDQFKRDLNSQEVKTKIEQDYQGGVRSGVNATPTFFLNGKKLPPPSSYGEFENTISQAINANP
jgi:protein-disulfide isomerase